MLKYTPREQFVAFHNRQQRWASLNTHRRAGKTVSLVNDLIFGALECSLYKPQLAYVGPTYAQAKRVAWTYLKDYAAPYMSRPPQEAELKITLHGDRTLYVLGADNADALRGMYLDGGVGDEYALFRPSVFSQVIRPTLSDRNGWFVFASTPRGKNLFYDVCQESRKSADWFHLELRADTSGIIPARELEELRKHMDPEEYAQEYLCSFDSALKGAIYAEEVNQLFHDGRYKGPLFDENLSTNVIFDLGFTDATVAIYWQEHKGSIRIVNAEATQGKDIFHHIERIHEFAGRAELGSVWLPHDARARNLQTGRSIVEQFLSEDIKPGIVPTHKIRDRLAATRKLFTRISIDSENEGCQDLVEALKGYRRTWNESKLMFEDQPLHDWCSDYADAFGYMCVVAAPHYGFTSSDMTLEPQIHIVTPSDYNLDNLFADREARHARIQRLA